MQMELEYVARELDLKINNRDVSLLEYLEEVDRLLTDPLLTMQELKGDMTLTDWRDMAEAGWKVRHLVTRLHTELGDEYIEAEQRSAKKPRLNIKSTEWL